MIVQDLGDLERITIAGFTNLETKLLKENKLCNGRVKSKKRC
jgi:hypothetical protein